MQEHCLARVEKLAMQLSSPPQNSNITATKHHNRHARRGQTPKSKEIAR